MKKYSATYSRISRGKWPRVYAAEICELKTKKERLDALQNVPEDIRELVKKHVEIFFDRKKINNR